jgi:hypothetical protein
VTGTAVAGKRVSQHGEGWQRYEERRPQHPSEGNNDSNTKARSSGRILTMLTSFSSGPLEPGSSRFR